MRSAMIAASTGTDRSARSRSDLPRLVLCSGRPAVTPGRLSTLLCALERTRPSDDPHRICLRRWRQGARSNSVRGQVLGLRASPPQPVLRNLHRGDGRARGLSACEGELSAAPTRIVAGTIRSSRSGPRSASGTASSATRRHPGCAGMTSRAICCPSSSSAEEAVRLADQAVSLADKAQRRADEARHRAEEERLRRRGTARAARLADKLRELGIDPDTV